MRRTAFAAAVLVVQSLMVVGPAAAGGSHLSPVRDRYERGEVATLVGYTSGGQLGWVQDGPFYAYLVAGEAALWSDHRLPADSVALGPLSVQARGRTLRVSISFLVPDHLAAGLYNVTYCNDPCTTGLGDLIGGSLAVGVDPPRAVQRTWPLDEPEIANLADGAILTGPGGGVTAADVRAGRPAEFPRWGSDVGPALEPGERPAPPIVEQQAVPSQVTTILSEPLEQATRPDPSGERPEHRLAGILLLLTASVIAVGAVTRLQRPATPAGWGPKDRQTPPDESAHLPSRTPARVGGGEG